MDILSFVRKDLENLITEYEEQKHGYQDNLPMTAKLDEFILELYAILHQIEANMVEQLR